MNQSRGLFVAVDGPKHAGKSTVLAAMAHLLRAHSANVYFTKEPSRHFQLANEASYQGEALARLLVDDRRRHLDEEILPALRAFDVVVTDRYIASSLAFQVLDGVPFDTVWELNRDFLLPDVNIFLVANEPTLVRRSATRKSHTRIERIGRFDDERALYLRIVDFFRQLGVDTKIMSNDDSVTEVETAHKMSELILSKVARREQI